MRIQDKLNVQAGHPKPEQQFRPQASFNRVLNKAEARVQRETLAGLLQKIESAGEQLAERRTLAHLFQYKRLVKQFLEEAVRGGLKWMEREGRDARGRLKVYHLIEQVDQHLLELTDELLATEEGRLKLLAVIGEIKGLLVELYG
ncbi:protein of unknown function DUF327 [Caldalkalibacillus thermarum TA2.A1]|uniref:YaaR family protein n=1 Tax=Caldalkalibacillus thermarum (strain TA2.A1) TaxID=986075 RepID=F5L9B4_CALTT|nr:YaaR family protein [Caldalkalibacillus thermarum]EGL82056.1 protein of unknown function DUF327 [Caldalkalibacillus thermarum TA2.A1]QZT34025.1 YaaR family protein [Caldalkalibacillus thermarum TA2.A1]